MLVWCPASSLIERIGGGDRTTEAQRFTEKLRESQKGESSRTFSFFLSPSSSEVSAPLWCVHPGELEELPVSRRNQVSAGKLPAAAWQTALLPALRANRLRLLAQRALEREGHGALAFRAIRGALGFHDLD